MMFTFLLGFALAAPPADAQTEVRERAAQLVVQLGDGSFRLRESAAKELVTLGSAALDALRKGLTHPDTEIGERCRKLLPLALDHHLQEQIAIFLAKPNGPIPDDLPAIKRWTQIAGSGKESRQLYAQLVREHRRVLIEMEQEPGKSQQRYQSFCQEVYNRNRGTTVEARKEAVSYSELVLFLFLGSDAAARKSGLTATTSYLHASVFVNSTHAASLLSGASANDATKRLFLSWLEHERYATLLRRGFQMAATADLKEAAPLAIRMASDKEATAVSRAYALTAAAKLFGPDNCRELEKLMKDDTVVIRTMVANVATSAEIRDIALGVAIQASGQKPLDFGFERFRDFNGAPATVTASHYYFTLTDKQREAAHKKWTDWTAKQKK